MLILGMWRLGYDSTAMLRITELLFPVRIENAIASFIASFKAPRKTATATSCISNWMQFVRVTG
jgi:hypothetical protein